MATFVGRPEGRRKLLRERGKASGFRGLRGYFKGLLKGIYKVALKGSIGFLKRV